MHGTKAEAKIKEIRGRHKEARAGLVLEGWAGIEGERCSMGTGPEVGDREGSCPLSFMWKPGGGG